MTPLRGVEGRRPSEWNAEKGLESLRNVALEGNRPASRVTATPRGRYVVGQVQDCDRHGVVGATVQLQRHSGRRWRTVTSGRTSVTGAYTLRARRPGTYRARAGSGTSRVVRVR